MIKSAIPPLPTVSWTASSITRTESNSKEPRCEKQNPSKCPIPTRNHHQEEKNRQPESRCHSRSSFINDPVAKFFLRKIPDSQKQTKTLIGREGLLKLPQLWKKAKRCAAFSHSCLDKPSQKRAQLIHSSNKPGSGSLIKFGTEEKGENLLPKHCWCLTHVVHLLNHIHSSVASLRPLDALLRKRWTTSIGMPGRL